MAEATIYSVEGEDTGRKIELPESVFGVPVNSAAIHQAILAYQVNQAQQRPKTKTRSEVRGGGRKPYRQKGTGHARQGSRVAPHWRGGGVVFGPTGVRKRRSLTKRLRRTAVCSALSARAGEDRVVAIEPLVLEAPSTAALAGALAKMGIAGQRVCIVLAEQRPAAYLSLRNVPGVQVRVAPSFCTYDVVGAETVVVEEAAVELLAETLGSPMSRGGKGGDS
jgi:large subunit ribosomal protein L4